VSTTTTSTDTTTTVSTTPFTTTEAEPVCGCTDELDLLESQIVALEGSPAVITSSGNFITPEGVTSINVLLVGGGGGGTSGHNGGGGSGLITVATSMTVTPATSIPVIIGAGGSGAQQVEDSIQVGISSGGTTSFGALTAAGGAAATSIPGGNGYS